MKTLFVFFILFGLSFAPAIFAQNPDLMNPNELRQLSPDNYPLLDGKTNAYRIDPGIILTPKNWDCDPGILLPPMNYDIDPNIVVVVPWEGKQNYFAPDFRIQSLEHDPLFLRFPYELTELNMVQPELYKGLSGTLPSNLHSLIPEYNSLMQLLK